MISKSLTLLAIAFAAAAVVAPGRAAPAAVLSYTGCLGPVGGHNVIFDVLPGDVPQHACGPNATIRLSSGDLTSLTAGTGLTGGGTNGDISIALAPGFRLPQSCGANQGTTWNGSAWVCASLTSQAAFDSLVSLLGSPGTINQASNPVHWTKLKGVPAGFADGIDDAGPAYSAGFGLSLAGTQFNVDPAQVQRRVADSCASGSSIRAIAVDGTVTCQPGAGYTAGAGLALNGTEFSVADGGVTPAKLSFDPATQAELDNGLTHLDANNLRAGRVPDEVLFGAYSNGLTLSNVNNVYLGSLGVLISRSASSSPLQVKGATGQTAPLQAWVDSTGTVLARVRSDGVFDGNGSALTNLNADSLASGTVPDGRLSGDVARYSSISTPGTVNDPGNPLEWSKLKNVPDVVADPSQLQRRVSGSCGATSAIRAVHNDGTVDCETVSGGGTGGWGLNGTSGTDGTNYLGTSDDQPLNFKVNGERALRLEPRAPSPNVIGGHGDNSAGSGVAGAAVGGGGNSSEPNSVQGDFGTIGGGRGNLVLGTAGTIAGGLDNQAGAGSSAVGGGVSNFAVADGAAVAGGEQNEATGPGAFIGGGFLNRAEGQRAVVPGGSFNEAIGDWSFAAGAFAHADHFASFVWNGGGPDTHSTGDQQFVVRAAGGLHLLDGKLFCNGCVTSNDLAPTAVPGVHTYCSLAASNPASYPDAPCRVRSEAVDATGDVGANPSVAISTDGNPVMSYVDQTNHRLKVARCNDPSCSGENETVSTVDATTHVSDQNSLAIGTDGNPVISYWDDANSDLKVARCNDPACSGGNETLSTVDSQGTTGSYSSLEIGTDGNPVISYYDNRLRVAHCNDPACTGHDETIHTIDGAGFVGLYSSLAIGLDGNAVISYFDITHGDLKVAACVDPACSDAHVSTLDSAGNVGQYDSLTIGTDGNPVISYWDSTNDDLKVAHCIDPGCRSGGETLTTVDASGLVGQYTSIAIGNDGNPIISYFEDNPRLSLKLADCNDPSCSGGNETITTADPNFEVGFNSSIALGIDGNPVIAHYDLANRDLKVTHPAVSG